jgi:hypothetical protein
MSAASFTCILSSRGLTNAFSRKLPVGTKENDKISSKLFANV